MKLTDKRIDSITKWVLIVSSTYFVIAVGGMLYLNYRNFAPEADKPVTVVRAETEPVKKSVNGICHEPGSTYYIQTENYEPYNTLNDCINSGGRLPLR